MRQLLQAHNNLSGSIRQNSGALDSLELLDLSDNLLTGSIPSELGDLGNLDLNNPGDPFSGWE